MTQAFSPAVTYTYTYTAAKRVQTVTDNRGPKTITYRWSDGGRLNTVINGENTRADYLYDPVGRLMGVWAPNLDYVSFQWDAGNEVIFPFGF